MALEASSEHRNDHSVLPRPEVTPVPNVTVPIILYIIYFVHRQYSI